MVPACVASLHNIGIAVCPGFVQLVVPPQQGDVSFIQSADFTFQFGNAEYSQFELGFRVREETNIVVKTPSHDFTVLALPSFAVGLLLVCALDWRDVFLLTTCSHCIATQGTSWERACSRHTLDEGITRKSDLNSDFNCRALLITSRCELGCRSRCSYSTSLGTSCSSWYHMSL